jgi:hypothetical protein
MYFKAMRHASIIMVKQSDGVAGATIGTGRLAVAAVQRLQQVGLLGLGGQAGDGPPRCTSMITSGSSTDDGQVDGLALERHAGAGGGGDGQAGR